MGCPKMFVTKKNKLNLYLIMMLVFVIILFVVGLLIMTPNFMDMSHQKKSICTVLDNEILTYSCCKFINCKCFSGCRATDCNFSNKNGSCCVPSCCDLQCTGGGRNEGPLTCSCVGGKTKICDNICKTCHVFHLKILIPNVELYVNISKTCLYNNENECFNKYSNLLATNKTMCYYDDRYLYNITFDKFPIGTLIWIGISLIIVGFLLILIMIVKILIKKCEPQLE